MVERTILLLIVAAICMLGSRFSSHQTDADDATPVTIFNPESQESLVPPIVIEDGHEDPEFNHDSAAHFHAHGNQVCASGCALSRHPTATLTRSEFDELLLEMSKQPLTADNKAYETLLYYGRQTTRLLNQTDSKSLSPDDELQLRHELQRTHAKISIRVVDEHGEIRTWLDATRVPLDRRHEFTMQTNNLQDLVTSGTVKRVGLHHLWTRL
ncbi:MAG: hypothetical protein AAF497_23835 [Planctomycetota bacterium]